MSMPVAAMEAMLNTAVAAMGVADEESLAPTSQFVANDLQSDFDELVRVWNPIHNRMADDELRYRDSEQRASATKDNAGGGGALDAAAATLAITFSRTIITAARRADMLLPNNDSHGEVEPDDVPHIPEQDLPLEMGQEPIPESEVVKILKARAEAMGKQIKSQFAEAKYEPKLRRMLEDSSRVGWGVLKGPCMGVRKRRRHKGAYAGEPGALKMVSVTEIVEESRPDLEYVNVWHFVADLAPTIDEAEKAFHIHISTDRDMRERGQNPGFDKAAIRRVISQKPRSMADAPILATYAMKNHVLGLTENLREVYVAVEYNGPIRKKWATETTEEMEDGSTRTTYRCDALCTTDEFGQKVPYEWEDDGSPLPMVQIWFCQGEVLKFKEAPLECDSRLMYYVDTCHRIDDTFAGGGIPYILRSIDRAIQAAWQMALHNGAMSSGPLILVRKGAVEFASGKARLKGPTVLMVKETAQALNDVVKEIITTNNCEQFLMLLDKAMMLADEIISLPLIAQGKQSEETAQGQAVRLNTNNIFQKRMAMGTDDTVLCPVGRAMIEWNLTYGDPQKLGGDFQWKSKVNALLIKSEQAQRLQAAVGYAAQPQNKPYVDGYTMLKRVFESLEVATDGIVLPEDQARANEKAMSEGQPDPMIALKEQEIALKGQKIEADNAIAGQKIEASREESQAKFAIAQMNVEQAFAALALQEDITIGDIQVAITKIREDSKLKSQELGAKVGMKAEELAHKERAVQTEIHAERFRRPGPVIATQ